MKARREAINTRREKKCSKKFSTRLVKISEARRKVEDGRQSIRNNIEVSWPLQ